MQKDKQDEAQRHAQRNYVIKEVRNQLVHHLGYSYTDADILIGRIWGVGERKIREIIRSESFSADELEARQRFKIVSQAVATRSKDLSKITADKAAFLAQKDLPGGKKTLRSWYWMVELEAYDENQG